MSTADLSQVAVEVCSSLLSRPHSSLSSLYIVHSEADPRGGDKEAASISERKSEKFDLTAFLPGR